MMPDEIQLVVDSLSEADQILEHSKALVKKYDYLSVADLYETVGNVGTFDDTKIGWNELDLEKVRTERTTDGLSTIIAFPKPSPLDI